MKVEMVTLAIGPWGRFVPGQVVEVSAELGRQWLEGGYAKPVRPARETAVRPARETAVGLAWTGLSLTMQGILRASGLGTRADLERATDAELLSITGVGPATVRVIRQALAKGN